MPAWQSTQVRQPGQEVTAPLPKGIAIASTSLKRRKKGGLNRITAAIGLVFLLIVALWIFNALPQQNAASLLANAINGNPLLVDSLHSDTGRRWPQNRACRFSKGAYSVQGLSDSLKTCVSSDPKLRLENAVIVVDVTLSSGSGEAGLVFGASGQRFYVFKINDQGTFSFLRHDPGRVGYTTLKIQTASNDGYFNSGGLNTLAVIANGSDFKFYVNGTYVGESRDTSYGGGEVGFAASGRGSFSNLKIYPAP